MSNASVHFAATVGKHISINARAAPLVEALVDDASALGLGLQKLPCGARVIDAGVASAGSYEAGVRIAEICLAGLGSVRLVQDAGLHPWRWQLNVTTSQPVLACLASQYAGWSVSAADEKGKTFSALGSGPARALARREPLFEELGYADSFDSTVLVLEASRLPPEALALKVCEQTGVTPDSLSLIVAPTGAPAGIAQIVARVVEVGLHKAHTLGFELSRIVEGLGAAPLAPPTPDALAAMGRTNDAILFGGQLHLFVNGPDEDAKELAESLPSSASPDYGKPFAEVFAAYEHDFFKIDPMLFSPARVAVTACETGRTYFAGVLDQALLDRSFGAS